MFAWRQPQRGPFFFPISLPPMRPIPDRVDRDRGCMPTPEYSGLNLSRTTSDGLSELRFGGVHSISSASRDLVSYVRWFGNDHFQLDLQRNSIDLIPCSFGRHVKDSDLVYSLARDGEVLQFRDGTGTQMFR